MPCFYSASTYLLLNACVQEHTELKNFSMRWEAAGRAARNLLRHKEGLSWDRWLEAARSGHKEPEPTKLQEEFVSASLRHYSRKRRIAQAFALVFAALLVTAAVVCGFLAVSASRARDSAVSYLPPLPCQESIHAAFSFPPAVCPASSAVPHHQYRRDACLRTIPSS